MARKLSNSLKKKGVLKDIANISKQFDEEADIDKLPQDIKEKIINLKDDMLLDDPENKEIYGKADVERLAETIKQDGFQGVILAYPFEGKYRIESGHRRREAARLAGFNEHRVFVTEPPLTNFDRILRLHRANLHDRKMTPMVNAKVAQSLYEAHEEKIKYKKANNLLEEGEISNLNLLVGKDMELSQANVQKYRYLLNLIPILQEMADSEKYSWSALAAASTLPVEKQEELALMIKSMTEKNPDSVKKAWLEKTIKELKLKNESEEIMGLKSKNESEETKELKTKTESDEIKELKSKTESEEIKELKVKNESEETKDLNDVKESDEKPSRIRRKNGTKTVMRGAKLLHEVLDDDALFKNEEIPTVLLTLNELKDSIEKKINELKGKTSP